MTTPQQADSEAMSGDACLTYTAVAVLLVGAIGVGLYGILHLSPLAAYLIAINAGTLLLYRYDKVASKRDGAERAPNALLAALAIAGGSLGALFGIYMEIFPRESHKTKRKYWWLRLLVGVSLVTHLVLLTAYLLFGGEAMLAWAQGLLAQP
jgi:uncharacterized membrane protein YsdA (DUF1294 family)